MNVTEIVGELNKVLIEIETTRTRKAEIEKKSDEKVKRAEELFHKTVVEARSEFANASSAHDSALIRATELRSQLDIELDKAIPGNARVR